MEPKPHFSVLKHSVNLSPIQIILKKHQKKYQKMNYS